MSNLAETKAQPPAKAETPKTIKGLLTSEEMKKQFAVALPRHLSPERFIRVALTALTKNPKLAECDQASFFQCLLTLSQFGLEPDGRRAHLIPFNNTKRNVVECQLIIDYKGYVELVMNAGDVSNIHADKVCTNDDFVFDRGQITSHKIDFKQPRGDAYAFYCVVRFKDGTEKSEVMTKDEVEKIRARSKAKDSGPWVTDFDEMAKKTVFRRVTKWVKLSSEVRDALDADQDRVEEERRFQAAKSVAVAPDFTLEPVTPALEGKPVAAAPSTEPPPASEFVADTPQKKISLALNDASVPEEMSNTALVDALKNLVDDLTSEGLGWENHYTVIAVQEALNSYNKRLIAKQTREHRALCKCAVMLETLVNLHDGVKDGGGGIKEFDWQQARLTVSLLKSEAGK